MSDKRQFRLVSPSVREAACKAIEDAQDGYLVTIQPPKRSLLQNARMWCLLADVSSQVDWYGRKLTPDEWKDVLSASYRKQDVVPGIDGTGFVVLGMRTSQMTVGEMNELQLVIEAFGASKDVKWSEPDERENIRAYGAGSQNNRRCQER